MPEKTYPGENVYVFFQEKCLGMFPLGENVLGEIVNKMRSSLKTMQGCNEINYTIKHLYHLLLFCIHNHVH